MSEKSKSGSRKRASDRDESDSNHKSLEVASPRKKPDNKFQNPPSAYLLFITDQKNKLKDDHVIPKEAKDQSTFFSNLWKKVSDAEKETWQQKAAQEKLKWQKRLAQHYQEHGTWPDEESENEDSDERAKKRQRKDKKSKDPNEPKRPNSAYNIFIAAMRPSVKAEKPNLTNTEIMSELARRWSKLAPEKKEKYNKRAAEEKEKYNKEIERYESQKHKSKETTDDEEEEQEGEEEEENGEEAEGDEGEAEEGDEEEEEDEEE
eukprot:TRINITY_DN1961_c0_g1_i1.p2 TRINITY_DN1961_c0_g1~~TRINITY_DN1961_c0_g1_i1.p2  ORF type:complete len:262 (-),score=115.36 TRINITY_DN1961_c0_g1_i1:1684-2469(-)